MLCIKRGASINGIRPEIWAAIMVAEGIWREDGEDNLTITSGTDGTHSTGSLHYSGAAVDLRIKDIRKVASKAARLRNRVGRDFDVVLESTHIHIEFQPHQLNG